MFDSLLLLLSLAAVAPVAEAPATHRVPAGTELVFEMVQAVGSKGSQRGDRFDLRLAEPLYADGRLLLPVGTPAVGEVVHADRARSGGQAGELILAARYLVAGDARINLRSFKAGTGRSRTGASAATSVAAGPLGLFVRGGNIELPAGTLITAQLREDTSLPAMPEPGPAEPQAEPEEPEIQQENPGETTR